MREEKRREMCAISRKQSSGWLGERRTLVHIQVGHTQTRTLAIYIQGRVWVTKKTA